MRKNSYATAKTASGSHAHKEGKLMNRVHPLWPRRNGPRVVVSMLLAALAVVMIAGPTLAADAKVTVDRRARVQDTSLALDSAGLPVIAYVDVASTPHSLKVAHCSKPNCRGPKSITTVDTGLFGFLSMALDSSGSPVIAYQDVATGDIRVLHCGNADCTAGNAITPVDTTGQNGEYISLVLDASGFPVASYRDVGQGLNVLHCGDATCTSGNSIATPDPNPLGGTHTSVALDASGFPVVSYRGGDGALRLLHCGDPTCTAGNTIATPAGPFSNADSTSVAVDASGLAVIAFRNANNLSLVRCGDAACTPSSAMIAFGEDVADMSIALALDGSGFPVISYVASSPDHPHELRVLHCGDAICSVGNSLSTVDDSVGWTSLALDGAGFPVVSYADITRDAGPGALKVVHCDDAGCD
jgi:hypothetical protein